MNAKSPSKSAPSLTPREAAAMAFASKAFKKPWFELAGILARLERGEELDNLDREVDPVLLPLTLDANLARWAMKLGGLKLFIGQNSSMLTLVLNEAQDQLIWACIEGEQAGVYTELVPLSHRVQEDWARELVPLLRDNKLEEAFEKAKHFIATDPETNHIALGVIKVANIRFFEAFQKAWEKSGDGENTLLLLLGMQRALEQIARHGWVKLFPAAGLQWSIQLMKPALALASPANKLLIGLLKALPGSHKAA